MPQVPVYDSPQVAERPLPGVRQESAATPALLGSGADSQIALGQGETAAGTGLDAIAVHMQERANLQKVQDAIADYGSRVLDWQTKAKTDRVGAGAAGVVGDFSEWHVKQLDDIGKTLDNDAQRQAFTNMARKQGLAARHDIATFEVQETRKAGVASFKAAVDNSINAGAGALTPEVAEANKRDVINNTRAFAAVNNLRPEDTQALLTQNLTEFHAQRIQNLAVSDPASALQYFKDNKKEIAPTAWDKVGGFAEKATAVAIGSKAAQTVWAEDGPKGDNDASNIDKMKARIREDLKDNTFARDAALHEIAQIDADRDKAIRARDSKRTADVNLMMMNGANIAQVQKMPAWLALDGTEQRKILLHEESIAAQRESRAASVESRAAARESRAYTREVRAEHMLNTAGIDTTMRLADPGVLVGMDRNDVINLRPTLGTENTQALLNKWDAFTKNGTLLTEAKVDNNQFNAFVEKAGLDPLTKDTTVKQRINDMRDSVERMIGIEQQTRKRPLTREEKDALMQKQIDDKVMQHNVIWFDKPVPAVSLTPDQQKSAYVTVDGRDVKLSDIPAADREAIITSRRRHGLPITEQAIAEAWVKKNTATRSTGSGREMLIPQ